MFSKKLAQNLLLTTFALIFSILTAEGFLRYYKPYSALRAGYKMHTNNPIELTIFNTVDPKFGFRPILGNALYNSYGTMNNTYSIEKRPDGKRLLFIGDSATWRGKIIDALRHLFGKENFEYWNAGVETFNTVQELNFYKEYNAAIKPDHVILTFHLNDFETTPIAFLHEGKLVVYQPNTPLDNISPWLFQHSYIYRLLLGLTIASKAAGKKAISQEVKESLREMKTILAADDINFTVLILPYLKPYEKWKPFEKENRQRILSIIKELEITYFDLFDIMNNAAHNQVNVQESKGDYWHPSEEVSMLFAKYLYKNDIFCYKC
jgi:hypothetical protein